ncbi:MAG TPA: AmmeMemoRadiSam system protein A [Sedimentisphaerales bacterium]|nr:AmmeMemoRadiSam system protein A [Sedimentisphaerales bacterium]
MDEEQREILLKTAKEAVVAAIAGGRPTQPFSENAELNNHCGCFVTIKQGARLRGCLGQFESRKPLISLVSEMAASSATQDPRFISSPIRIDELSSLEMEISVLSPLKLTDDPLSLRLGVDGIYIRKGYASGCLLPQVAAETGWSKEEFLSYCCQYKAGLARDAWKQPDTQVFLFTAEVFGAYFKDI